MGGGVLAVYVDIIQDNKITFWDNGVIMRLILQLFSSFSQLAMSTQVHHLTGETRKCLL